MDLMRVFAKFRQMTRHQKLLLIESIGTRIKARFYYPMIFGAFGSGSLLFKPTALGRPENIYIGSKVLIGPAVRLETVLSSPGRKPMLVIGDDVNIEQNVHIVCHHRVHIGKEVSITANCAIVDTTHPFDGVPAHEKVGNLIADDDGFVEIGDGTFIGIGTVVLPNVRIGKGCIIGANSVVTKSIPDYSVASGAPAIVRRFIDRPRIV